MRAMFLVMRLEVLAACADMHEEDEIVGAWQMSAAGCAHSILFAPDGV